MDGLHPGQTANVLLDGKIVGIIGGLHPAERKELDLKETFVVELNLSEILNTQSTGVNYEPVPRFPLVTRDIAIEVEKDRPAGDLERIILQSGTKLLKQVKVFDVYEGDKIQEGKKSVAFTLTYFDPERTLTDEEVSQAHGKVLKALEEAGATIR